MPPENGNEWHEWKGEVSATLKSLGLKMDELNKTISQHTADDATHFGSLYKKLNELDKSNVRIVAIVAAVIWVVSTFGPEVAKFLFK